MFGGKKGDPRVARVLDRLNIRYSVDQDGDYRATFDMGSGRSQLAFINSNTEQYGAIEMRKIWSVAHINNGPLPANLANDLLIHNSRLKVGAWRIIRQDSGKHVLNFYVTIAADPDPQAFHSALLAVLSTADEMERKINGRDDF